MTIYFDEIKRLLPQKFPMLMVDRVVELEKGIRAVAIKSISGNEIFFQGHFPHTAVMPGALILEGMAQVAILLFRVSFEDPDAPFDEEQTVFFFGGAKARFFRPVIPGDQLRIEVKIVKAIRSGGVVEATARVEDRLVTKAELSFGVRRLAEVGLS